MIKALLRSTEPAIRTTEYQSRVFWSVSDFIFKSFVIETL